MIVVINSDTDRIGPHQWFMPAVVGAGEDTKMMRERLISVDPLSASWAWPASD